MAQHMILPVITLTIVSVGSLMRYTRTNMLEVLNADYIRTARAKGVPEKKVVSHHAFRNTLIPIITILGSTLPNLFGGAMITETLFQIPGIGYTSYQALTQGDIPFTMFYMVFLAFLTLTGKSDRRYPVRCGRSKGTSKLGGKHEYRSNKEKRRSCQYLQGTG